MFIVISVDQENNPTFYINGENKGTGAQITDLSLNYYGIGYAGAEYDGSFNGTLDELVVWNTSLTDSQVETLYSENNHLITSEMTRGGEAWSAEITPNDGSVDGETKESNVVQISAFNVDVHNLSLAYEDASHYSVFRFIVENIGSYITGFDWLFNLDDSSDRSSAMPIDLEEGQQIFVFVEHAYNSSGTYQVVADGESGEGGTDSESINATVS